jgi:iron complex transport system permease protein
MRNPKVVLWCLAALLIVLVMASLLVGAVPIRASQIWLLFIGQADEQVQLVIAQLRLPRTLMAIMTGAALAVGGAAMQSLFRNPLAEPGLVGVSAGAALGAVLVLYFGLGGLALVGLGGFLGALLATWVAWQFARDWSGSAGLLLAGVAINALVLSLISLMISQASDAQLRSMTFWSLGSMTRVSLPLAVVLGVWVTLGLAWVYRCWPSLNALLLGEIQAQHVGVDVSRMRVILVTAMALVIGPLVAFTGAISFVGLIVPQILRRCFGSEHRRLIPLCALLGANLVLLADILSRVIVQPAELPIGVLISLVGAPTFLWLLKRSID